MFTTRRMCGGVFTAGARLHRGHGAPWMATNGAMKRMMSSGKLVAVTPATAAFSSLIAPVRLSNSLVAFSQVAVMPTPFLSRRAQATATAESHAAPSRQQANSGSPSPSGDGDAAATSSASGTTSESTTNGTSSQSKEKIPPGGPGADKQSEGGAATEGSGTTSEAAPPAPTATRNILIFANTTKGVYVHWQNHIASWYWMRTDFHPWLWFWAFLIVGLQLVVRYRAAKVATAQQARLGETLLDQRTRELLTDIEQLRGKDPLRLEHEANAFHDQFWGRRAKMISEANQARRSVEMSRGVMQGEARGTDMTEWLGAKVKDEDEREVARRTHDYIQGFHQHLKSKRLI